MRNPRTTLNSSLPLLFASEQSPTCPDFTFEDFPEFHRLKSLCPPKSICPGTGASRDLHLEMGLLRKELRLNEVITLGLQSNRLSGPMRRHFSALHSPCSCKRRLWDGRERAGQAEWSPEPNPDSALYDLQPPGL